MLYISTLGFDEKFVVRFLMRHGIKQKDKFLLIVVKDFERNEKAKNAYNNLRNIVATLIDQDNFFVLPIDVHDDPIKNIKVIANEIISIPQREIRVCLSGGMRILIILVVLALRLVGNRNIAIDVDFEDLSGHRTIQYTALIISRNVRWIEILKQIKQGIKGVRQLANVLGLSPATISRELTEMEEKGLIEKKVEIQITSIGEAYMSLHSA